MSVTVHSASPQYKTGDYIKRNCKDKTSHPKVVIDEDDIWDCGLASGRLLEIEADNVFEKDKTLYLRNFNIRTVYSYSDLTTYEFLSGKLSLKPKKTLFNSDSLYASAIFNRNFEAIEYLIQKGIRASIHSIENTITTGNGKIFLLIYNQVFGTSIENPKDIIHICPLKVLEILTKTSNFLLLDKADCLVIVERILNGIIELDAESYSEVDPQSDPQLDPKLDPQFEPTYGRIVQLRLSKMFFIILSYMKFHLGEPYGIRARGMFGSRGRFGSHGRSQGDQSSGFHGSHGKSDIPFEILDLILQILPSDKMCGFLNCILLHCDTSAFFYLVERGSLTQLALNELMIRASDCCLFPVAQYLVDMGADIHFDEITLVYKAIQSNDFKQLVYLISQGINLGIVNHLNGSVQDGNYEFILRTNPTLGSNHTLMSYPTCRTALVLELLLDNGYEVTDPGGIEAYISKGSVECLEVLVKRGANLACSRFLFYAIKHSWHAVVKYLISLGARAISSSDSSNIPSHPSILILALNKNQPIEVIEHLINTGADLSYNSNEAIKIAASCRNVEVVKILVENGADVRIDDDYPIRIAAKNDKIEVVKYLIDSGSNVRACNDYPLRVAKAYGYEELYEYLRTFIGLS